MPIGKHADRLSKDGHFFSDKLPGGAVNDHVSVFDLESLDLSGTPRGIDLQLEHSTKAEARGRSNLLACANTQLQVGHNPFFVAYKQSVHGHGTEGAKIDRTVDDEFKAGV